jgi:hypothetical protein
LEKSFFKSPTKPEHWALSIKLGKNHPMVKRIQVCSNKGPGPFESGDNHEKAKKKGAHLRIFSRSSLEKFC